MEESLALFQRGQTFNSMTKRTRRTGRGARRGAERALPGADSAKRGAGLGADGALLGADGATLGASGGALRFILTIFNLMLRFPSISLFLFLF